MADNASRDTTTVSMKKAALAYAAKGWPVFPVKYDKTPYTKNGVHDATTIKDQVEAMWTEHPNANIGMNVGAAGMMAADMDPGHDFEEFQASADSDLKTALQTRTPRGGRHLFFELKEGEIVAPSASKVGEHIDIRSFNSYVLLPPSSTKHGSYDWIEHENPAYRPDGLLSLCTKARQKSPDRDKWIIEADLPENVNRAIAWLKSEAKVAIEGHGGDELAYQTAAMMKSYGISRETAVEIMWDHWNPRCVPPWDAGEWEHFDKKVENGYSYNTSEPGNMTHAFKVAKQRELFKPVETSQGEWTSGKYRVVNSAGMANISPPQWIIPDFLPEQAQAMLFGPKSTFKTFVALDIALSIASGSFGGASGRKLWPEIKSPGPVLFCAGEGRSNIKLRKQAWEEVHNNGIVVKDFYLADPVPLVSEPLEIFIETMLMPRPEGYKLVVIDTVGRAMQGLNENTQEHASSFTRMIETLKRDVADSVLVLHHTGHGDQDHARGSSVFGADTDVEIKLERTGREYTVALDMKKQKDDAEWPEKRYACLEEIELSEGARSLVTVKANSPAKQETKEDRKQRDKETKDWADAVTAQQVEEAAMDILLSNKTKKWRKVEFSEVVADMVDLSPKYVNREYLSVMRCDHDKELWHHYHPRDSFPNYRYSSERKVSFAPKKKK